MHFCFKGNFAECFAGGTVARGFHYAQIYKEVLFILCDLQMSLQLRLSTAIKRWAQLVPAQQFKNVLNSPKVKSTWNFCSQLNLRTSSLRSLHILWHNNFSIRDKNILSSPRSNKWNIGDQLNRHFWVYAFKYLQIMPTTTTAFKGLSRSPLHKLD